MKNMDDDSRQYDIKELKSLDDRRFRIIGKEALFSELFFLGTILAEMAAAYLLCPDNVGLMKYLLGFPAWFVAATAIAIASWLFVLFHNAKISKDFSLDAHEEITEEEQK